MENENDEFIEFVKTIQEKAAEPGLTEEVVNDILRELAQFYAGIAIAQADAIWDNKELSNEGMEKWLNQNS
jgi:hypothetical protein